MRRVATLEAVCGAALIAGVLIKLPTVLQGAIADSSLWLVGGIVIAAIVLLSYGVGSLFHACHFLASARGTPDANNDCRHEPNK